MSFAFPNQDFVSNVVSTWLIMKEENEMWVDNMSRCRCGNSSTSLRLTVHVPTDNGQRLPI